MFKSILSFLLMFTYMVNGQIRSLKDGMKAPMEVVHLKLKRERLEDFPEQIFEFENLEILDLSNNRLTKLPAEIVNLKKLKEIILAKNNFSEFPIELLQLEKLEHIDLWDNFIENLPKEVLQKGNLKFLDIRGVLLKPDVYEELSTWFTEDVLKISPPCDCMY